MHPTRIGLLILLLFAQGCGPTPQQVMDRHRPGYAALQTKLDRIAAKLPAPGKRFEPISATLSPPLVLIENDPSSNCESLMDSDLLGKTSNFDLRLSDNLGTSLYWISKPPNATGDPAFMDRTLAAGLKARYLVVHRVDETNLATAVSDELYVGGDVPIEGYVFDLEREELVASYRFMARHAETVEYEFRQNESAKERLEAGARSTVWTDARKQLAEKLRESTGGRVSVK